MDGKVRAKRFIQIRTLYSVNHDFGLDEEDSLDGLDFSLLFPT
jgi:hypothetical protein